jgi:hypothetical protein
MLELKYSPAIVMHTAVFLAKISSIFCEDIILENPIVTKAGLWGKLENCTDGFYVTGYQLRVEAYNLYTDNTALNGIRFFCGGPIFRKVENISVSGSFGSPTESKFCPTYATGFQLKSQKYQGITRDDAGAINMKLICEDKTVLEAYEEKNPNIYKNSAYTERRECEAGYALCGLQAQIERPQGLGKKLSSVSSFLFNDTTEHHFIESL